jgi:2-methylcitrate dehydratase PrpD
VPQTVHQAKFSMGAVLGLIAVHGSAQLIEFRDLALTDPDVAAFREKVSMELDPEVDNAYPARWLGRVIVTTTDGRTLSAGVDEPKGDPGNTLSRAEIEAKVQRLLAFSGARTVEQGKALIQRVWQLRDAQDLVNLI